MTSTTTTTTEEEYRILQDQNRILNICTKVSAALSMVCSAYIAYSVLCNKQKRSSPVQRIILGMSMSDIMFSFFLFCSTWLMPRGTPNVYGATYGNTQTCTLQGFFLQLGLMTPIYNGFLALYCYLYVCKDLGLQRMKQIEVYGHIFVFVFALCLAILGLPLKLYNSNEINICWMEPYPSNCTQSFQTTDGMTTNCERGDNAVLYQFAILAIAILFNLVWTLCSMIQIYCHIRKQEKLMESYTKAYSSTTSSTTENNNNGSNRSSRRTRNKNSDSREVAIRGALFTVAFFITVVPVGIGRMLNVLTGNLYLPVEIMIFTMVPSQGIFNFIVYILHPAVSKYFKERAQRRRVDNNHVRSCENNNNNNASSGNHEEENFSHREEEEEKDEIIITDPSAFPNNNSEED